MTRQNQTVLAAAVQCFGDDGQMHNGIQIGAFRDEVSMECSVRSLPKIHPNELNKIIDELESYNTLKLDKKTGQVTLICEYGELAAAIKFVDGKQQEAAGAQ